MLNYILLPFRYVIILAWVVLMISSSLMIRYIFFNLKVPVWMARTMFSPVVMWACGARMSTSGKENLDPTKPYIFVSNHKSYLDIPTLFQTIPHNLHFIAKKEVRWIPFIGWYMMGTGMIFVDRSNKAKARVSLEKAAKLIKKGKDVLMFPEGTRSKDGKLMDFKGGAFKLAKAAGVDIVPVAIKGTEVVLPPGTFFIKPHPVEVVIGKPISSNDNEVGELIKQSRQAVVALQNT